MKRKSHISDAVQAQIVREYREKNLDGSYRWLLREIAARHEVSLSTVNNLAKIVGCQDRTRGRPTSYVPDERTLSILQEASEPFSNYEDIGRRYPRRVVVLDGKVTEIPLSKQRISQIVRTWRKKLGDRAIMPNGFRPGDIIEWDSRQFVVVRYDNTHRGKVIEISDGEPLDPFSWFCKGSKARLVKRPKKEPSERQIMSRYLKQQVPKDEAPPKEPDDHKQSAQSTDRAAA